MLSTHITLLRITLSRLYGFLSIFNHSLIELTLLTSVAVSHIWMDYYHDPTLHSYKALLEFIQNIMSNCVHRMNLTHAHKQKHNILGGGNELFKEYYSSALFSL